jgi:hypothetical protein
MELGPSNRFQKQNARVCVEKCPSETEESTSVKYIVKTILTCFTFLC